MSRLRSALGLLLLTGVLVLPSSPAAAVTSGADPSFGDNGEVQLVLPDGTSASGQPVDTGDTVYVGGSAYGAASSRAVVVALDQRGRLRSGFGRGGVVELPPPTTDHEPLDGVSAVVPDGPDHLLVVSHHLGAESEV